MLNGHHPEPAAQTALPAEFRPAFGLRLLGVGMGAIGAWAAVWQVVIGVSRGEPARLVAALVAALPCLLAAVVLRRKIVVQEEALVSASLLGARRISWESVRRIDQTRASFVVVTHAGAVSAGLIAARDRERLMRLILERARLTASQSPLRWGLVMQFVPRAQPISLAEFRPHNRRKAGN